MYNLSHVKTARTYTPAQLETRVKSCQLSSSVVPVRTTISHIQEAQSQFLRECSCTQSVKCFVKRSAVLFFVSTRLTDLQRASIVCCVVAIFDCRNFSARRCVPSSSVRCPATEIDESAEEDHPCTSPTGKLSVSKSSLCRRHSIEVCPNRMDHPYSFCRVVSRGNPQEELNLGLAASDSPLEIASRLSSSKRNLFSLFLAHSCHVRSLRVFIKVGDLILEIHLRTLNVRVSIGYDLKLLSNCITHSSSC